MAWIGIGLSAFMTFIFFLATVRNANRLKPFSNELCDLYLLEHMLPDNHPFQFMYKGLPRNRDYPRLFWPCMATFVCVGITLIAAVLAAVLGINGILANKTADAIFLLSSIGSTAVAELGFMAIPALQNKICFRRMFKTGVGLGFNVRDEIGKKWPGFFKTSD